MLGDEEEEEEEEEVVVVVVVVVVVPVMVEQDMGEVGEVGAEGVKELEELEGEEEPGCSGRFPIMSQMSCHSTMEPFVARQLADFGG